MKDLVDLKFLNLLLFKNFIVIFFKAQFKIVFKRLFTSFTFNYNSGRPYTLPVATYNYEGIQVPQYDFRNQNRLPDYHRLDLSVKWHTKNIRPDGTLKKFTDYWTLTIYNVYGRKNVYSYVYDTNELGETEVIPYSIFDSIVPSVTYHFRF